MKDILGKTYGQFMALRNLKSDDEALQYMQDHGLNLCDKCNTVHYSEDLVWITTEDFTPREGEVVPQELYEKYDALCEECYKEEIL